MNLTLQSILWKITSCACFACINIIVRYLTGGSPIQITTPLPIYEIMFFQYLMGTMLSSALIYKQINKRFSVKHPLLNITRVALAVISTAIWYSGLRFIPITEVIALGFIAPFITVISAIVFLKERISSSRLITLTFSLIGGFFILRPDKNLGTAAQYGIYTLLPITAACLFALDKILVRKLLSLGETPELLAMYLLLFITPVCLIPSITNPWIWPTQEHIFWLSILGMLCAFANIAFNNAYKLSEVTFLMPFGAAKILISGALSYVAFTELPKSVDIWIGLSIIIVSTLLLKKMNHQYAQT